MPALVFLRCSLADVVDRLTTTPPHAVGVSLVGQTLVTVGIAAAIAERSAFSRAENDRVCASAARLKFEDDQRVPFACECGMRVVLAR